MNDSNNNFVKRVRPSSDGNESSVGPGNFGSNNSGSNGLGSGSNGTSSSVSHSTPLQRGRVNNGSFLGRFNLAGIPSKIKGALSGLFGHGVNVAKSGFRGLKNSWFGLKPSATAVSTGVGKVANYIHLSKAVTAGILSVAVGLGGTVAVLTSVQSSMINQSSRQEWYAEPCEEKIEDMVSGELLNIDVKAAQRATAWKIWGLCKAMGWTDEAAAALLGCMQPESGIDPTAIEGIYNEHFQIESPRKKAALADLCHYCTDYLFPKTYAKWNVPAYRTARGCYYAGHSGTIDRGLNTMRYGQFDGHFGPGIGLVQRTGGGGAKLFSYANSAPGHNWYDLDLQMAFHIDFDGDSYGRVCFMWGKEWPYRCYGNHGFSQMIPQGTTVMNVTDLWQACQYCELDFVGHKPKPQSENKRWCMKNKKGEITGGTVYWYAQFKGQKGDQAFARSVVALANEIQGGGLVLAIEEEEETCEEFVPGYNNEDLARAAVAYAYEKAHSDSGSDFSWGGTDLYRFLHDNVFGQHSPGWYKYKSCDISVSTAVRWSDADPNSPHGNTSVLDPYYTREPQWEFVGRWDSMSLNDLQAGDILITTRDRRRSSMGHIVMYVTNEIVREKYPNSTANTVAGSWGTLAPHCQTIHDSSFSGDGYYVYRLNSDLGYRQVVYRHIADGMNLANSEHGYISYSTGGR